MALKIIKAQDPISVNTLVMLLYGMPGAGKTSTALTAKNPLLLDFDNGAHRCIGRKDSVQIKSWKDITSLSAQDLQPYDSIIIDTVGRALEFLAVDLIAEKSSLAKGGALTLQGYGAINQAFKVWIAQLRQYGKNIILLAHDKEEKNGDLKYIRPDAMGSAKDEIKKISDMIGYVYLENKNRIVSFDPTEAWYGKNSGNIPASRLPDYNVNKTFLQDIIDATLAKMNAKTEEQKAYEEAFAFAQSLIDEATTSEELAVLKENAIIKKNVILQGLLAEKIAHTLIVQATTSEELNALITHPDVSKNQTFKKWLIDRATELNYEFSKELKEFVLKAKEVANA